MALKAGSVDANNPDKLSGSMAEAMEDAFQTEWLANKGEPLSEVGREDRLMFFAAIAQGLLNHLSAHANDGIQISVTTTQDGANISSGNGSVSVTQNAGSGNRVQASGSATDIQIVQE